MKITKGMKLTPEQKAQRAASRARNEKTWLEHFENERIRHRSEHDAIMASSAATLARLEAEIERRKYSDMDVDGSFRFILGFKPEAVRGLQYFVKIHKFPRCEKFPAEYRVAISAIQFALANPDQFSEFIEKLVSYAKNEGVDYYAHAAALSSASKKYQRLPLRTKWLP